MVRVFSQKHSSTSVGNDGISSVGKNVVEQIGQNSKTDCFAGISQEGLSRKIFAKTSCLHPVLTLRIPIMCRTYASLRGMLTRKLSAKTLLSSIYLESSHSLSLSLSLSHTHTQILQINPTINTGYKRLNIITIKFDTK